MSRQSQPAPLGKRDLVPVQIRRDEASSVYVARAELVLARNDSLPLREVPLEPDPLSVIARAMNEACAEGGEGASVVLDLTPVRRRGWWVRWARARYLGTDIQMQGRGVDNMADALSFGGREQVVEKVVPKLYDEGPLFQIQVLLRATGSTREEAHERLESLIRPFEMFAGLNAFRVAGERLGLRFLGSDAPWRRRSFDLRFETGLFAPRRRSVVSWREIASFLKPPTVHCTEEVVRAPSVRSSAWARSKDLAPLGRKDTGRLTLGRTEGKLLAAEPRQSVVVIGPSGSMKTSGFAIPALLEWEGPVVAASVKTDLLRDTLAARKERGRAWVYDPSGTTGLGRSTWSPLSMCQSWQGAQRTARWLSDAARDEGLKGAEFWHSMAVKLLAPLLFAAAISGRSMKDVVAWVDIQEQEKVASILEEADAIEALQAAAATWGREDRQRSSVYSTAEMILEAFSDPSVAASASSSEISPEGLLDESEASTLYVCAPLHEQRRLRPLFQCLVESVLHAAYEAAARHDTRVGSGLLVILDEAANIAPLPDLDQLASTASGQGIQLVTVWQDLSQIATRYGERRAYTVVNNHRAKVVLSGISDPPTLEYASRLLGDEEIRQASVTTSLQGRSTTHGHNSRRLAPADVLRQILPGEGILIYGHLPPVRLELRPWFKEPGLRAVGGHSREALPEGGSPATVVPFPTDRRRGAENRRRRIREALEQSHEVRGSN